MAARALTLVAALRVAHVAPYSKYDRDVVYDFESSLEGWGGASSSEMGMDVAARGGHLVGTVGGGPFRDAPHLDSPPLAITAAGRQSVAIRMKYQGSGTRGARLAARYGAFAPGLDSAGDHGRSDWTARGLAVPVTLSGGPSGSAISDGDAATVWVGGVGDGETRSLRAGNFCLAPSDARVPRNAHPPPGAVEGNGGPPGGSTPRARADKGGFFRFAFRSVEVGARLPAKGAAAHAVTELEIRCDESSGPSRLELLASGGANASGGGAAWEVLFATDVRNGSAVQRFATRIPPDRRYAYWRVAFPSSRGPDVRVRELRSPFSPASGAPPPRRAARLRRPPTRRGFQAPARGRGAPLRRLPEPGLRDLRRPDLAARGAARRRAGRKRRSAPPHATPALPRRRPPGAGREAPLRYRRERRVRRVALRRRGERRTRRLGGDLLAAEARLRTGRAVGRRPARGTDRHLCKLLRLAPIEVEISRFPRDRPRSSEVPTLLRGPKRLWKGGP